MTNTQYNWYVGMPVIMTADSRKGECLGFPNREYKGKINIIEKGYIRITLSNNIGYITFNLDGSCPSHPGMSIRPAEEFAKQVDNTQVCPSQWIEGQITAGMPSGIYGFWHESTKIKKFFEMGNGSQIEDEEYTHYIRLSELPPPPPVKEVEAFGYLKFCDKLTTTNNCLNANDIEKILAAKAFYSQPATAEDIEKYFDNVLVGGHPGMTIDQWISWYKREYSSPTFTPAALDMLRVK